MRDFKSLKSNKVKSNRQKHKRPPRNLGKLLHCCCRRSACLGCAVLILSGVVWGARSFFDSSFFRIDSVLVEGQGRVGEAEILDLSEVRIGASLFDLDLEMVGGKIEENPWIADARIERVFPRQLVIRVVERTPRAIINLGYLYYADERGEIFKLVEPGDSLDYPVLTGIDRGMVLEDPAEARRALADAVNLLGELSTRKEFRVEDVSEINIHRSEGLVLYTSVGGIPIRMGYSNFGQKLDRLERVYAKLKERLTLLKSIDLNVVDRVIVKVGAKTDDSKKSG